MTGLDKITSGILSDARQDADRTIEAAEAQCRQINAEFEQRRTQLCAALGDEAEREANDIISRAKSSAAMEKRNIMMTARSRLVDAAFERAKNRLLGLPAKEYTDLLTRLACSAFREQIQTERVNRELYGDDDMPVIEHYELILNSHDKVTCGRDVINNARNLLAGRVDRETVDKLKLSDSTADIDGGIILRYGDVEINCSVSMIMEGLRDELESAVCEVLFAK